MTDSCPLDFTPPEFLDETGRERLAYAKERETLLAMQLRMKVAGWKDDTFADLAEDRRYSA